MIQSNRNATSKQTESPKRQFSIKKEAIAASSEIIKEDFLEEEDDSPCETNENPIESLRRELADNGQWLEANPMSPDYKKYLFVFETTFEKLKVESPDDSLIPYYEKKLVEWKKQEKKAVKTVLLMMAAAVLLLLAISIFA